MKVLHVLYSTQIGGTERAVLNYLKENKDKSVENYVVAFNDGELSSAYKEAIDSFKLLNSNNVIKNIFHLAKIVRSLKIDIIYAYGLRTSLPTRIVSLLLKKKNIYGVRGMQHNHNKFIEGLNKSTLPLVDNIVTNSQSTKEYLINSLQYKKEKIINIPNGTYLPQRIYINKDYETGSTLKLICIANFNEVKGHIYLLTAFNNLIKNGRKLQLTLLGKGPLKSAIESFIKENNLEMHVEIPGQVKDVYPYLMESDVKILPSLSEGMPNAIMEAMACGLPVVCTPAGGSVDLIENKKNGLVIDYRSAKDIEEAIEFFLTKPDKIKKFGAENIKIIKNQYSFEKLVKSNNNLFEEILNNK